MHEWTLDPPQLSRPQKFRNRNGSGFMWYTFTISCCRNRYTTTKKKETFATSWKLSWRGRAGQEIRDLHAPAPMHRLQMRGWKNTLLSLRGELCAIRKGLTSSFRISGSSPLKNEPFSQKCIRRYCVSLGYCLKLSNSKSGCEDAVLHLLLN